MRAFYHVNPISNIIAIIVLCIFCAIFIILAIKDDHRNQNIISAIICAIIIFLMSFNFRY